MKKIIIDKVTKKSSIFSLPEFSAFNIGKRCIASVLVIVLLFSCPFSENLCFAAEGQPETAFNGYKITNPYKDVAALLQNDDNHYKTNLHTHSTVSDGDDDYADMIKEFYNNGFDVLAMADHGVIGKYWNEEPYHVPLYAYQYILGRKTTRLTDSEYKAITEGTYAVRDDGTRTYGRGMKCVPGAIELNMLTITKSHVNGYFVNCGLGDVGLENGFEYAVKMVDDNGGVSHINHPGDWLGSHKDINVIYSEKANVFTEVLMKYKSCLGIEVFNHKDTVSRHDRVLWDKILTEVIPYGERNVYGFSNSDAHVLSDVDSAFMDFILPEFTLENMRSAMENGQFFAISRFMRDRFADEKLDEGDYPTVNGITVDDINDTITITGKNCDSIEWIADGNIIQTTTEKTGDTVVSTIRLRENRENIGCYVRAQLIGKGGVCLTQPFICDDGNMSSHIIYSDNRTTVEKIFDKSIYALKSLRVYVILEKLVSLIAD